MTGIDLLLQHEGQELLEHADGGIAVRRYMWAASAVVALIGAGEAYVAYKQGEPVAGAFVALADTVVSGALAHSAYAMTEDIAHHEQTGMQALDEAGI